MNDSSSVVPNTSLRGGIVMSPGTPPGAGKNDQAVIYSTGSGSATEISVMDAAGNTTVISPHNAKGEWVFYSVNFEGDTTYVNMIDALRVLEKLSGKKLIYSRKIEE
jgi:hypothetical protein